MIPPEVRDKLKLELESLKKSKLKLYIVVFRSTCDAWKRFEHKNNALIHSYTYYNKNGIGVFSPESCPEAYLKGEIWPVYIMYESFRDPNKEYIPYIQDRTYVTK